MSNTNNAPHTANSYAIAQFFSSWAHLVRSTREDRVNLIHTQLNPLAPLKRISRFQGIAHQLSGSESAYAMWKYNLMADDDTRIEGATINELNETGNNA
jgi:hypothetical protein